MLLQHFLRKTRMKLTALLNKCRYRDPTVFPAWEVLQMATIEGAQAVGLGDEVGSLEPGKLADLVVLDHDYLDCPEDEIREIKPTLTMVGGKVVFERK